MLLWPKLRSLLAAALFVACAPPAARAATAPHGALAGTVDAAARSIMQKDGIPGMAVGVIAGGKPFVFNYGVASKATGAPVGDGTLFELGSVSKTLTATLTAYAHVRGFLALTDPASKYLPALRGSAFGNVTLLELGTHTPGGLPLQVPDRVTSLDQLMAYLKAWRPAYTPGTYRTYSNVGIGTLGLIAAKSMGANFDDVMQLTLFPALGMTNTYIDVPESKMAAYAEGYRNGTPVRMTPGMLWAQAYGIRTTAADMLRFIEANMNLIPLDPAFQRAIADTHSGYFQDGAMTQDLIWEQYGYPAALQTLRSGNSATMILDATPVRAIAPPERPRRNVWINKTGSTNGFGAYVAFVPAHRAGVVILANENFPIRDRVDLAYRILAAVIGGER